MTDIYDTKTETKPIVWTHDDDPEALAESIVSTVQFAQQVIILVEDGSLITGNVIDGFRWLEGDEISEPVALALGSTSRAGRGGDCPTE